MIRSFSCKETAVIFEGKVSRKLPRDIQQRAMDKLRILDNVTDILELRIPPSNRLEALQGKRQGQYSIRINQQWRICFRWENDNAHDVEITDYH